MRGSCTISVLFAWAIVGSQAYAQDVTHGSKPVATMTATSTQLSPTPAHESSATQVLRAHKGKLNTGLARRERPTSGPGTYVWASGSSKIIGRGNIRTYSVGVEHGIGIDPNVVAKFIEDTLADPRSWTGHPDHRWGFQRVDKGGIKFVIASPETVDKQCAPLDTAGQLSCAMHGFISVNLNRWEDAVWHWTSGIANYRRYLINHEMGHWLGQTHRNCPEAGAPAPVMMQQTLFLKGCEANPWPFPHKALKVTGQTPQ